MRFFKRVLAPLIGAPTPDVYISCADAARDRKQWTEAAENYAAAVRMDDGKAWIWVQYAHALKESGALNEAREAYERAMKLAPDDPDPLLHLAHLLKRLGDRRAIERFQQLQRMTGDAALDREIETLATFYGQPGQVKAEAPPAAKDVEKPATSPPPAPPNSPVASLGISGRPRGVRFIGHDRSGELRHKFRLIVDGAPVWSGVVAPRLMREDGTSVFDLALSFAEPTYPTDVRRVVVETVTVGLEPSRGEVHLPYAARFAGEVLAVETQPFGCTARVAFTDAENLTTKPFVRVLKSDGSGAEVISLKAVIQGKPGTLTRLECQFSVKCLAEEVEGLAFYPMWSVTPLPRPAPPAGAEDRSRLVEKVDFEIEGNAPVLRFDWLRRGLAGGWARLPLTTDAKLVIDILHGEEVLGSAVASRYRPDLAAAFGTTGTHAFEVEFAPGLPQGLVLEARARSLQAPVKPAMKQVPPLAQGHLQHPADLGAVLSGLVEPAPVEDPDFRPSIAAIVLNRNGAGLLRALFESVLALNTYSNLEFIIVDHESTDDSESVCDFFSESLAVRFVKRGFNGSFSSSNNFGAGQTDAKLLFFLNNDAVFVEDILQTLVQHFQRGSVGAVGLRLLDRWGEFVDGLAPAAVDQHIGVFLRDTSGQPKMYELRASPLATVINRAVVRVPAVTAAAMLMRRVDYLDFGGFDERYFYGQEDVDLCLRITASGRTILCDNRVTLTHLRGFTREIERRIDKDFGRIQARNRDTVQRLHSRPVHRRLREKLLTRAHLTASPSQLVFLVTSLAPDTLAGDVFTAQELAAELSNMLPAFEIRFVAPDTDRTIDVKGADVLINMRDDFDPRTFKNLSPTCHVVFWVRNNFDRFLASEAWQYADDHWFSSECERARFEQSTGVAGKLLRIATNWNRFDGATADPDYSSDYCFTGSCWGVHRDITVNLVPASIAGTFRVFGSGWNRDPVFAPYAFGSLQYSEIPRVYASTRIVIDDANHVTVFSASVNSRVFDAIAAGALPITNGLMGAREAFGDALPTYSSAQDLHAALSLYLADETARLAKVAELQDIVRREHTYAHRGEAVLRFLTEAEKRKPSIAIKISAPKRTQRDEWGDYHYAEALRHSFARAGARAGIFFLDEWDSSAALAADVSLVLRGLNRAKVHPHQLNLMWVISHPDKVSLDEYRSFDHVFVASQRLLQELSDFDVPSSLALQCTDNRRFRPDVEPLAGAPDVLFVGNSRGVMRPIVADAVATGLELHVYGEGWAGLLPSRFVRGTHIPNWELPRWYASAGVVLNDHWPSMAEYGIVSNRVFDILASGGRCISDANSGSVGIFGDIFPTYTDADDLRERVLDALRDRDTDLAERRDVAGMVRHKHSFDLRATHIINVIEGLFQRPTLARSGL